jgi:hypothetical protein
MLQYWGNSYGFGYIIVDADAQAWVTAVEGASGDNQPLEDAIKRAVDTYVQALKTNSIWTSAAQLLLPCGPRTLAGALRPLKGAAPTNGNGSAGATQFTSDNYSRKNGLGKTSNASAYLNNNVATNSVSATSHALFAYGAINASSGDSVICGRFNGATGDTLIVLDEWSVYVSGRAFRSGTFTNGPLEFPLITATAAVTCMVGSRTSSSSAALYVDGTTATNATNRTLTLSTQNFYTFAYNNNNASATGFSSAILQATGIFSTGLNATQAAALRSATATYVAAINAAF